MSLTLPDPIIINAPITLGVAGPTGPAGAPGADGSVWAVSADGNYLEVTIAGTTYQTPKIIKP